MMKSKIEYKLNIDDFLNYQEYLVLNKKDDSLKNIIFKWKIFVSVSMIIIFSLVYFFISKGELNPISISMFLVVLIIIIYNWINGEKIWWKDNKNKFKKINLENSFINGKELEYILNIEDKNIIIERENNEDIIFNKSEIENIIEYNNYIFIF